MPTCKFLGESVTCARTVRFHEEPTDRLVCGCIGEPGHRILTCSILNRQLAVTARTAVFLDACPAGKRVVLGGVRSAGYALAGGVSLSNDSPFLSLIRLIR